MILQTQRKIIRPSKPSLGRGYGNRVPVEVFPDVPVRATEWAVGGKADSIQVYHTGAASDGDVQESQAASLGGSRSSSRAVYFEPQIVNHIRGLRIDFISGANLEGNGQLIAIDQDSISWAAPRGRAGPAVTLSNGQTARLDSGNRPDQYVIVTRTSTNDLIGTATVFLASVLNNVIGGDNTSDTDTTNYRCICFKATKTVLQLKIWVFRRDVGLQIGLEQPASQPDGAFTLVADEDTAPGGVVFADYYGGVGSNVIDVARLESNYQVGLWIKRSPSVDGQCTPLAHNVLRWSFNVIE